MNREPYNNMDEWFKEAAGQPGPPVNEAAWLLLEARLDQQKKKRRGIFWWWFGGLFLVGIGLLSVIYFNTANQAAESRQKISKGLGNTNRTNKEDRKNIEIVSEEEPSKGGDLHAKVSRKNDSFEKAAGEKDLSKKVLSEKVIKEKVIREKDKSGKNINRKKNNAEMKTAKANDDKLLVAMAEEEQVNNEDIEVKKDSVQINDADSVSADKPEKKAIKKPASDQKLDSHFYVYAGIAPEWSYIRGSEIGSTALSYGGGIGYRFSRKLAVQIGVFSSGKKYMAGAGDYTPKPGTYYDNPSYIIESVEAECRVLEIPLALRYTFLQRKKSGFFVLAGFQSSFMKKEYYDYSYKRYGNPAYSSHSYSTNDFKLFSGASIAAGWERRVNKNMSMVLMPYYNIPLQGIGEGQVFLHSFGLQGQFIYRLPF